MNDSQTPLGSNRDRHELVGRGLIGDGLATFLGHPAFAGLPAITETWEDKGEATEDLDRMRSLRTARPATGKGLVGELSRTRGTTRARGKLVELGVAAAEVVRAVRIRAQDLDLAHGQRRPARATAPKPRARSRPPRAGRGRSRRRRSSACSPCTCGPTPRTRRRTGTPCAGTRRGRRPSRSGRRSGGTQPRPEPGEGARLRDASSTLPIVFIRGRPPQDLTSSRFSGSGDRPLSSDGHAGRSPARGAPLLFASLALAPATIALHYARAPRTLLEFVLAALSLVPLAWLIGEATEHAAEHTGPGVGGFLTRPSATRPS